MNRIFPTLFNRRPSPLFVMAALTLATLACALAPSVPTATLPALVASDTPAPAPAPTLTPAPTGNGTIAGQLGYPSEVIPPMTLYFLNVDTSDLLTLSTRENQADYTKGVPPGTYHVYAWLPGFGLGGSYSAAVPCGLTVDCTDHTLLDVVVTAGATTSGVDVLDWYGPPGSVPLPAGATTGTGTIQGILHYPSEGIPALVVYARNVTTNETFSLDTAENQQDFTLTGLPPGVYHVFAWVADGGLGGAYTQAVPCGLTVDCTDHTLIQVPVAAGQTSPGVDIGDWYEQSVVPLP